jgi:hypothetical protein
MRYQPTDLPNRSHVGPKWNRYYLRSVQLVLQATHGVVSGEPDFYKAAFGASHQEFEDILFRPHHMIFSRHWYERYDGRGELDDYRAVLHRVSSSERAELIEFLSARMPADYARDLRELPKNLRRLAQFYVPISKYSEAEIRRMQQDRLKSERTAHMGLTSEEIVEDAGLEDDEVVRSERTQTRKRTKEAA